jgi:hypothetical protein
MATRVIVGVALLLMGVGVVVARRHWLSRLQVVPVDMAIPVATANFNTGSFRIDIGYTYEAEFIQEHPGPGAECLVGRSAHAPNCQGKEIAFRVEYELYHQDQLVDKRITTPTCYDAAGMACTVTTFVGRADDVYKLDIHVINDEGGIVSNNARLIVHPHQEFFDDWAATYYFLEPLGSIFAAVGALLLGWSLIALLHSHRTVPCQNTKA